MESVALNQRRRFHVLALGWSLILGVVAGFLSHLFVGALLATRERAKAVQGEWSWVMPGLGGLAIGCIGVAIYANTGRMGVLGIGYEDLSAALFGELGNALIVVLMVGKFAATISSYSSEGAGGIFAPTLFIGAMLGGVTGLLDEMMGGDHRCRVRLLWLEWVRCSQESFGLL